MSIIWRSFDVLLCMCVCHILYVSWCSWSMSTHGYICEHRECNDVVYFCVFSLSLCLFTLILFHLAAHCFICFFFFPSSFLPFFPTLWPLSLCCSFSLLLIYIFTLVLYFISVHLGLPSSPTSLSSCSLCRVQETSGLSPAVGCGRHGEDAWAGLEVCVHVPAGVLQGSGDEGPG